MNNKMTAGNIMTFKGSGRTYCSYPIGVGVALEDGTHYEAIIKPHHSWKSWCLKEESSHRISKEILDKHGKDLSTVCMELNALCKGKHLCNDDYIWAAHWLEKMYSVTETTPSFTCFPIEYVVDRDTLKDWDLRKNCIVQRQQEHFQTYFERSYVTSLPVARNKTKITSASNSPLEEAFLISNILHKLDMTTLNAHGNS